MIFTEKSYFYSRTVLFYFNLVQF